MNAHFNKKLNSFDYIFYKTGTGPTGADEIKAHRFFKGINWMKLARKEISAPFKPNIQHELDTNNFSDDFTKMAVIDQPCKPPPNHERLFRGKVYRGKIIQETVSLTFEFIYIQKGSHTLRLIFLTMTMYR